MSAEQQEGAELACTGRACARRRGAEGHEPAEESGAFARTGAACAPDNRQDAKQAKNAEAGKVGAFGAHARTGAACAPDDRQDAKQAKNAEAGKVGAFGAFARTGSAHAQGLNHRATEPQSSEGGERFPGAYVRMGTACVPEGTQRGEGREGRKVHEGVGACGAFARTEAARASDNRQDAKPAKNAEAGKVGAFGAFARTGSAHARGLNHGATEPQSPEGRARLASFVRMAGALSLLVFGVACGPKVQPSTFEHEDLGRAHATAGSGAAVETGDLPKPASKPIAIDLAKLDAATIEELDLPTAAAVIEQLGDRKPAARVALRAARLAHHQGDDAEARAFIAHATGAADEAEVHAELTKLGAEAAEAPVDRKIIAVLLPLTGRFAAIGGELKVAIELAQADGATWLFLDTKGEPDGAVAAVETAAKKGAVAILGPVGTREAISAARAASLHGIPIGLLAPADGADAASGVFRLVGSPADEGRAVARLAQADSFPTVAVFAPRDDVGSETAAAFVAEAQKLGLSVTKQATYDPTDGNVEPDVKELLDLVPARNPRLAEHLAKNPKKGWQTFSPDVPFTLLYIPDRYDRAAIVAAFLPYFGVELRSRDFVDPNKLQRKHGGHIPQVVQLVGGAGWHHPSLPVRGGDAVQGALIVDTFVGAQGGDIAVDFTAAFQQKTHRAPSGAAAEAYDAATLMAKARASVGTTSPDPRGSLRAALSRGKLDDGACGPATMDVDGEVARTPEVLEVQGDELVVAP